MRFTVMSHEFVSIMKDYLKNSRNFTVPDNANINFQQARLGDQDVFVLDVLTGEQVMANELVATRNKLQELSKPADTPAAPPEAAKPAE